MRALGCLVVLAPALALGAGLFEVNHPLVREGTAAYEKGDFETAAQRFTEAAQQRPKDAKVQFNRADALHKAGKPDEALEALRQAEALDPTGELKGPIHYNRGTIAASQGKRDDAVRELKLALRENPADAQARHNLEVVLKQLKSKSDGAGDGGTPDGGVDGGSDGGQRDAGTDGGQRDGGGNDAGPGDGGQSDGGADGGRGDGGTGDAGQGDGGKADGGQGEGQDGQDGGQSDQPEPGRDGGQAGFGDAGVEQPEPLELVDGGLTPQEAKRLLDSLRSTEKTRPFVFDRTKTKRNDTHGKDW